MKPAQKLFDTWLAFDRAEDEMTTALQGIFGEWSFEDFTHDHYDESIELLGFIPDAVTPEQEAAMWELGFSRFWCGRCGSRTERMAEACWHCRQPIPASEPAKEET